MTVVAMAVGIVIAVASVVGAVIAVGSIIAVGADVAGTVVLVGVVPPQAAISMAAIRVTGRTAAFLPIHFLVVNIIFPPEVI